MKTGIQALQDAIKAGKERAEAAKAASGVGSSLGYFNWGAGDKKVLRLLTDEIITAEFYTNILNNKGKTANFLVDEADPDRIRRYMSPTPGLGWQKEWGTGNLIEPQTRQMTVGIAVLREEVLRDGKMVVQDHIYEKDVNGEKIPARFFGIIQQAHSNFWEPFASSCYERHGNTFCSRDYEVMRTGVQRNTTYQFIPLSEDPTLPNEQAVQQNYFYGAEYNKEDPDRFLKCSMTLMQWATYFGGEERFKHWLTPDGGSTPTPNGGSGLNEFHRDTTSNPGDEAQATPPPVSGQFAALREQLAKKVQQ